jgi:metal-sulfur cluster biosynthetic enzyme
LDDVIDPCSAGNGTNISIVEMGLLDSIEIDDGDVTVNMRLTSPGCMMIPYFIDEVDERVGSLDGVESVELETDYGYNWRPSMMSEQGQRKREAGRHRRQEGDA